MAIYYADLGKSGTGDGSFGNQYGKDQWDTIDPAGLGPTALQIKGMATYTRDIKVCGLNTISKWPLITSQDPAVPFRINAPGHLVQFNQPSPQFFQGTDELSNAIIYCNDISLPATHDCFLSVNATWQFPGGLGGDVIKKCVVYSLANYIAMTNPAGTIRSSLIYELSTGYHLLKTQGILDTVLTNDTNFVGLTDGSWTDNGTTYGYTNHGGVPSGWDDADLYNYAIGTKDDVQNYVPSWVTFPVTPTTPRKGIHYAIEIFSNSLDAWASLTDSSVGIVNGVFRHITDRPGYDGSTFIPTYGANEIDIDGTSIAGNNTNIWKEGMIQKDGFTSNPAREIDIVACGQYATDSSFSFRIRNDQLFWNYCAAAGIEFTGRRVVMWIVVDDVFYQCARGRVVNNPYTETDYEFNVQDDAKLIHKMLPPLTSNPTNNPDVPDSSAGQAIPIVMGDVSYSKILKLSSLNTFVDLTSASDGRAFTCPAARYQRTQAYGQDLGIVILLTGSGGTTYDPTTGYVIHNGFEANDSRLVGSYLSVITGQNANTKQVYKIVSNSESAFNLSQFNNLGVTAVYIDGLLIDSNNLLVAQTDFNSDGANPGGAGIGQADRYSYFCAPGYSAPFDIRHASANTWWFKISTYSVDTKVSANSSTIQLVLNSFGNIKIWSFDTTLKIYNDISSLVSVDSAGTTIKLITNSASIDGSILKFEDIGFPLQEIGVRYQDISAYDGNNQYRSSVYPASNHDQFATSGLGVVTDKNRLTNYTFPATFSGVSDLYPYAKFKLKPLLVSYDRIFFLMDLTINEAVNIGPLRYTLIDFLGSLINPYVVSNGHAIQANQTTLLNLIPNDFYPLGANAGDAISLFLAHSGLNVLNDTVPFNLFGEFEANGGGASKDDLNKNDYVGSIICSLRLHKPTGNFSALSIAVKQVTLMGQRQVDTINGDIYASVKGEKTGPQTTDPGKQTNDVYHAFMHILEDYDLIPKNLVDYGDLPQTRADWHVGRTLTERKNSIDYLNELCSHSFVGMFGGRTGKRCLRSFQNMDSYGTPTVTHDASIIVRDSIDSFEKTDISQLFNSFLLQYNFDPGLQQFVRAFIVSLIDQYANFPDVTSTSNDYAITPSAVSPAIANVAALIAYYGFIYGSTFYTTDGSDTTDGALASAKGSASVAGDAFQCLGETISWLGYQNSSTIPTWFNFLGGLIGDPSDAAMNYADSKVIWDMCRKSFETNQTVKQAQSDISQLPWYIDTVLFDPANLSGHGTGSSAYKFLYLLALWATLQKYVVSYRIPINTTTVVTELLDYIYFKDKIYTYDQLVEGWIVHVEPDPSTDQLVINTILKPTTIEGVDLIIERGPLLNTDTITEGDHQTDTITETGV